MMENRESFTLAPVIAIVEPASDLRRISADVRAAYTAFQRSEADTRQLKLDLGRVLVEARKAFPHSGPKAKGWGDFCDDIGITQPRAWEAMDAWKQVSSPADETNAWKQVSSPADETLPSICEAVPDEVMDHRAPAEGRHRVAPTSTSRNTFGPPRIGEVPVPDEVRDNLADVDAATKTLESGDASERRRVGTATREAKRQAKYMAERAAERAAEDARRDFDKLVSTVTDLVNLIEYPDDLDDLDPDDPDDLDTITFAEQLKAFTSIAPEFSDDDRHDVVTRLRAVLAALEGAS